MGILNVAVSVEEIKDIWEKQLATDSDSISKKTDVYFKERQGASLRAFEYLPL